MKHIHDLLVGVLGKTVLYTYTNLSVTEIVGGVNISFDSFDFTSPVCDMSIDGDSVDILREDVNKIVHGMLRKDHGYEIHNVYDPNEYELEIGAEGDIIFTAIVPSEGEIIVSTKEVICE